MDLLCFKRIKYKEKQKKIIKKKKIYPINYNNITTTEFIKESIQCYHCKNSFDLGSNEIKIHCAGCDNFFHCGIAGKCIGKKCNNETLIGQNHQLSWCINCVPHTSFNKQKINGVGFCLCKDCS